MPGGAELPDSIRPYRMHVAAELAGSIRCVLHCVVAGSGRCPGAFVVLSDRSNRLEPRSLVDE